MPRRPSPFTKNLRSSSVRKLLARDLPSLPEKVAQEADTYILAITAAVWLDSDDRLGLAPESAVPDANAI